MSEERYWVAGNVSIPENKRAEFNSTVFEVLDRCGIRKRKTLTLAGKSVIVLEKPTADENGVVAFDYSIFEKKTRDISTYDMNSCTLNAVDRGLGEYGLAMNLILLLQECYSSDTCYFMCDRELIPAVAYMDLLCTLLQRRIEIQSRACIWDIMRFMRKYPDCDMPQYTTLLEAIPWDYVELEHSQLVAALVTESEEIKPSEDIITSRIQIKDASIIAKMDYLKQIMSIEYARGEKSLFQYLKKLLELPIAERKKLVADDNYGIIAEFSLYLLPSCIVIVFSLLNQSDFWETWDSFDIEGYADIIYNSPNSRTGNEDKDKGFNKRDFYKQTLRENQDEFLEFWDGENLMLSDAMKEEIQSWKTLWDQTEDNPHLEVEFQLEEILTAMEKDWSCRYVDKDFVDMILTHKESPEWRRILLVLKKIVDKGLNLFPELDRRTAVKWIKTYRPEFEITAMAAFCSLISNHEQRTKFFGF